MPTHRSFKESRLPTASIEGVPSKERMTVKTHEQEQDEELELIKRQLGLGESPLSSAAKALFSRFGAQLKRAFSPREEPLSGRRSSSSSRLATAMAAGGMQLVSMTAEAHPHHNRHRGHTAHVERQSSHHHEQHPSIHVHGFERIGISNEDLGRMFENFPIFVEQHGRLIDVEYIDHEGTASAQGSFNVATLPDAQYILRVGGRGGRMRVYNRAFHEVDRTTHQSLGVNFQEAMYVVIHELCHSLTLDLSPEDQAYFEERMRGPHIPFVYPERFLEAAQHGRPVNYRAMAGEYIAELMAAIYEFAPEDGTPLRDHAIEQLAIRYPQVARTVIAQDVDRLFAAAPGFDWDGAVAKFRKASVDLAWQFAGRQIDDRLRQLPPDLHQILRQLSLQTQQAPELALGFRIQTNSTLQSDPSLVREYQGYRAIQLDRITAAATRMQMDVPSILTLKDAWDQVLQQFSRGLAHDIKNRHYRSEYAPELVPASGDLRDGARHGQIQHIIRAIPIEQIRELWARIPHEQQPSVIRLLSQDAMVRLNQDTLPPAIVSHAQRVLEAAPPPRSL